MKIPFFSYTIFNAFTVMLISVFSVTQKMAAVRFVKMDILIKAMVNVEGVLKNALCVTSNHQMIQLSAQNVFSFMKLKMDNASKFVETK